VQLANGQLVSGAYDPKIPGRIDTTKPGRVRIGGPVGTIASGLVRDDPLKDPADVWDAEDRRQASIATEVAGIDAQAAEIERLRDENAELHTRVQELEQELAAARRPRGIETGHDIGANVAAAAEMFPQSTRGGTR
jgi:hypothetical protein